MPAFDDLRQYAATRYDVTHIAERSFEVIANVAVTTGDAKEERQQRVVVSSIEHVCEMTSRFASLTDLSPGMALKRNLEFAIGGIALREDIYVFRYVMKLAGMSERAFVSALHLVAETADLLEREFTGKDEH